jgi:hypothetical protein
MSRGLFQASSAEDSEPSPTSRFLVSDPLWTSLLSLTRAPASNVPPTHAYVFLASISDAPAPPPCLLSAVTIGAEINLWTSSFVLLTLIINAPLIARMLNLLRLNTVSGEAVKMRNKAKRALCRFTDSAIAALKDDEDDEFLKGANWEVGGSVIEAIIVCRVALNFSIYSASQ